MDAISGSSFCLVRLLPFETVQSIFSLLPLIPPNRSSAWRDDLRDWSLQHSGLECVRRDLFSDRDYSTSPPYSEIDATPVTDVNPSFRRLSTSHFRPS
jgi:hypothetical protein